VEKDHVLGVGVAQARLQREHRVELGLRDQAHVDEQRAELAALLRLHGERRIEAHEREQARARQELAEAEISGGLVCQAAR
jgi:hypothetical protein